MKTPHLVLGAILTILGSLFILSAAIARNPCSMGALPTQEACAYYEQQVQAQRVQGSWQGALFVSTAMAVLLLGRERRNMDATARPSELPATVIDS